MAAVSLNRDPDQGASKPLKVNLSGMRNLFFSLPWKQLSTGELSREPLFVYI